MACFVCAGQPQPHFVKTFDAWGLGAVSYDRCPDCGTGYARTLLEMAEGAWVDLCQRYHRSCHGGGANLHDPRAESRRRAQADHLRDLVGVGLLPAQGLWLDYGCGEGQLADLIAAWHGRVDRYDPFVMAPGHLAANELVAGRYDVVVSTAVAEHVRSRGELDAMVASLAENGVLALHTLVRGDFPADPDWFYLLPVHTVFFTNVAMGILLNQWGFRSSYYDPGSRLWTCFRNHDEAALRRILPEADGLAAAGFAAYWP